MNYQGRLNKLVMDGNNWTKLSQSMDQTTFSVSVFNFKKQDRRKNNRIVARRKKRDRRFGYAMGVDIGSARKNTSKQSVLDIVWNKYKDDFHKKINEEAWKAIVGSDLSRQKENL